MPHTTLSSTSVIFRFSKDALSLHSSTAQKRTFVFNNIARLETVPEELSEKLKKEFAEEEIEDFDEYWAEKEDK